MGSFPVIRWRWLRHLSWERERVQHKKGKITHCIFFCILSVAQFMIRPHNPLWNLFTLFSFSKGGCQWESNRTAPNFFRIAIQPLLTNSTDIAQKPLTIIELEQYSNQTVPQKSPPWTNITIQHLATGPIMLKNIEQIFYSRLSHWEPLCALDQVGFWFVDILHFAQFWKYSGCGSGAPWEAKWRGVKLYLAFQYTRSSVKLYLAFQYSRSGVKLYLALHLCTSFICSTQINRTQEYRESWRMPGG